MEHLEPFTCRLCFPLPALTFMRSPTNRSLVEYQRDTVTPSRLSVSLFWSITTVVVANSSKSKRRRLRRQKQCKKAQSNKPPVAGHEVTINEDPAGLNDSVEANPTLEDHADYISSPLS